MFLVDTNVWLERLLDQSRSPEVGEFLARVPSSDLLITDFAFHSICVILSRLSNLPALTSFVEDTFIRGAVTLVHLLPEDTPLITETMRKLKLDFDDAYQYVAAEKYDLTLVSFDSDFDTAPRGHCTPGEAG